MWWEVYLSIGHTTLTKPNWTEPNWTELSSINFARILFEFVGFNSINRISIINVFSKFFNSVDQCFDSKSWNQSLDSNNCAPHFILVQYYILSFKYYSFIYIIILHWKNANFCFSKLFFFKIDFNCATFAYRFVLFCFVLTWTKMFYIIFVIRN